MSTISYETASTTVEDLAKAQEIISALPPEEREKIEIKDGHITGPVEVVHKVEELLTHDKSTGTSGD